MLLLFFGSYCSSCYVCSLVVFVLALVVVVDDDAVVVAVVVAAVVAVVAVVAAVAAVAVAVSHCCNSVGYHAVAQAPNYTSSNPMAHAEPFAGQASCWPQRSCSTGWKANASQLAARQGSSKSRTVEETVQCWMILSGGKCYYCYTWIWFRLPCLRLDSHCSMIQILRPRILQ